MNTQQKRNCEETRQLLSWVLEAVAEISEVQPSGWSHPRFSRNMMLSLLVYSYYEEIWTAEDISDQAMSDPVLRYLCRNRYPSSDVVRQFRRGHREVLASCLAALFRKALTGDLSRGPCSGLLDKAVQELADQRIRQATLMEMIALDI